MYSMFMEDVGFLLDIPTRKRRRRRKHVCRLGNNQAKPAEPNRRTRHGTKSEAPELPPEESSSDYNSDSSSSTGDNAPQEWQDLLEYMSDEDMRGPHASWKQRLEEEEANWMKTRNANFEGFILSQRTPDISLCKCRNRVTVSCNDCQDAYMCASCDEKVHAWQPFHRRFCWVNGYCQPLPPTKTVAAAEENRDQLYRCIRSSVPLFKSRHHCVEGCLEHAELVSSASRSIIVVTERGRFDLSAPVWRCPTCSREELPTAEEWYLHGFFPGTPVRMTTIFHFDVFQVWRGLKSLSPGTSLRSFVQSLAKTSQLAERMGDIDQGRFAKAYSEWTYMTFEAQKLTGWDPMVCHACGPQPTCVHIDGNAKLYRYKSAGGAFESERPYLEDVCIFNKAAVDSHTAKTEEGSSSQGTNRCGVSTWTAGRNTVHLSSKRTQDETGLSVATCRHSVVLGCLNMYRGEIFAYSHFLHMKFRTAQFLASDIVCQYWPWAQRLASAVPSFDTGDARPYLSVMHGSSHAYYCQIKYGGYWQEGSGWAVMETTEQANALLSRAGNTTKHMSPAQRNDFLTDLVISWNERKHLKMVELLISKHGRMCQTRDKLRQELDVLLREHSVEEGHVLSMVVELRELADALSSRDRQTEDNIRNGIALCGESIRDKERRLSEVDTSTLRNRLRKSRATEKARLAKLLVSYEAMTGQHLSVDSVLEDQLPWENPGVVDLATKRVICDTYMRVHRATEEVEIVRSEVENFIQNTKLSVHFVENQVKEIEKCMHAPHQDWVVGNRDVGRYALLRTGPGVLSGLQALCRAEALRRSALLVVVTNAWIEYSR